MHNFLRKLQEIFPPERINLERDGFETYLNSTIPDLYRKILGVVYPKSTQEVQKLIRLANNYKVNIYPISTGHNWGYGSALPVSDNNLIIDLSKMDRIIEFDEELGICVLEPGVTQKKLYEYIIRNNLPFMIDPTGAGPHCSILGNALERGYGITPYGNHFESIAWLEVVLGNGEILRTGFAHFPKQKVANTFKYGIGPHITGLFTQANLGVVTKMAIYLMPVQEDFNLCFFYTNRPENLEQIIDNIRWLLLNRVLKGSINLIHRNRSLIMLKRYPRKDLQGKQVPEEMWAKWARELRVGLWNGICAIYGTKKEVNTTKSIIKDRFKNCTEKIVFISRQKLKYLSRFSGPLKLFAGNTYNRFRILKETFEMMQGKPSEVCMPLSYWRVDKRPDKDFHKSIDNCGLYWLAPVVPMRYKDIENFISIVKPIFKRYDMDLCITLTAVTDRAFDSTLPILFNKDIQEEAHRAKSCYEEALEALFSEGYIPYRVGIQSMDRIIDKEDPFWQTVAKIKKQLDPLGIIAPGRYCPLS